MPKTDWKARLGFKDLDIVNEYNPPEVIKHYYPGGYFGVDKHGCPIFIDPVGTIDFKGLLHSINADELLRMRMFIAECGINLCEKQSEKLGKEIKQITVLVDLEGLGLKHMWKPGVRAFNTITTMFEDDYPDLMKQALVVNAPRIFPVLFALVKPFLGEETKRKIKIFGGSWKRDLLKYIDVQQLPVHYGGTKFGKDGDTLCKDHICYGGEVPKSYYSHAEKTEQETLDSAVVRHGSQFCIDFKVTEPGSILHWHFKTEECDIGFGIFYRKEGQKNGSMVEVISMDKRQSHLVPEDGFYTCTENGIYVIKFDNSYSWTRNKKLHYRVGLASSSEGL